MPTCRLRAYVHGAHHVPTCLMPAACICALSSGMSHRLLLPAADGVAGMSIPIAPGELRPCSAHVCLSTANQYASPSLIVCQSLTAHGFGHRAWSVGTNGVVTAFGGLL